jgi:hypothetical protein
VTVLGACADTGGTSTYSLPVDLALDRPARWGSGRPIDQLRFSLGINPTGVPNVVAYSVLPDGAGLPQRSWSITAAPGDAGRTTLDGRVFSNRAVDGVIPNLLTDAETDLLPCDDGSAVKAPRALAPGATVTGWVDPDRAELTLQADTVDGARRLTAVVVADRVPLTEPTAGAQAG